MKLRSSGAMKSSTVLVLLILVVATKGLGQVRQLQLKQGSSYIHSLSFTHNGKQLLSASLDGTIAKWNLVNGERIEFFDLDQRKSREKYTISHIYEMNVSPNADIISISYAQTSVINEVLQDDTMYKTALIDVASLQTKVVLQNARSEMAFSPDGKILVTIGAEKIARIWDVNDGKEIKQFSVRNIGKPVFTPDGKSLVVASQRGWASTGLMIVVYDLSSNKVIQEIPERDGQITGVAVSPKGKTIAVGAYNGGNFSLKLWSLAKSDKPKPQELLTKNSCLGYNIVFSSDARLLASSGLLNCCETVVVRRVLDNKAIKTFVASSEIKSIAFSPDGSRLVYGTNNGEIFVKKL